MTATRSIGSGERQGASRPQRTSTSKSAARSTAHRRAGRGSGAGSATGTAAVGSGSGSGGGIHIGSRRVSVSTLLLLDVVLLCLIGLVMVGTASSVVSIATYGSPWAILIREGMWMVIGAVALWLAIRFDYRKLRRFGSLILLVTFGLLFVVLVPGLGVHAMGSSRWVGFGQFRLQPSELMKLALTLFAADFITRRLDEDAADRRIIGPLLIVTGFACVLILAQPDMGTTMVLGFIALALLFVSGVRLGPVMKVMAALAGLALLVAVASPYRRARLLSFMDPSAHSSGSGYQVMQSVIGLGSGHFVGAGLGSGQAQWGFLPNAHTDFIFSVIGEELGIVGAVLVLCLLGGFIWLGIRAAVQSPDRFGALVSLGLVAWVGAETLINVGAVVGVLPVTGIPLPFISFGGSSLVITMAAAGVLINVARQGEAGGRLRVAGSGRRPASRRPASAARGR
jgi:cell division protein FtsW